MFLTFLGPPTSLMIYITVNHNHQKCHFLTPPTHLFDDVILEWSLGINASMTSKYQARSTCEVFFFKYLFADCIHLTQLNFINFCHKMWA